MKQVIRVVGAVIFDSKTDSYFVGQRGQNKKSPLKWEFIGGKVKNGEDLVQALEREFKEEVGLDIKAKKLIGKNKFDYGGEVGTVEVNFIECEKFEGQSNPDPEVYKVCRWVPKNELPNLDWIEADRNFAVSLASTGM